MAGDVLADLTLRLQASTAEFNQKLAKAGETVNKFGTKSKKALRDAQKKTSESLGKMKQGFKGIFSGLTGQLTGITAGLGVFAGAIPSVIAGIKGLTIANYSFATSLTATGVGAIIVALGIALGALATYLTQTQEGMDLVSKGMNMFKSVLNAVMERVGFLGQAIAELFSGEPGKAWETAKKAAKGFGDQVKANYEAAKSRSGDEVKLREEKIKWITEEAKLEAQKAELLLKSRQEEKFSAAERVKFIKEAAALQKKITSQNISFKERELAIEKAIVKEGTTTAADREKLANLEKESIKLKEDEANKLRALVRIEKTALSQVEAQVKGQEKLNALMAERAEMNNFKAGVSFDVKGISGSDIALPEPAPLDIKVKPIDMAPALSGLDKFKMQYDDWVGELGRKLQAAAEVVTGVFSGISNVVGAALQKRTVEMDNYYNKEKERIQQSKGSEESKAAAMVALENKVAAEKKKIAKKQAKMDKANAILGAVVNGAQAVTKALAQGGAIFGPVLAGVVGALAAAQVAMIASTPIPAFANGGIAPGGMALVGERGPELVNLPQGARVHSNQQTQQLMGGAQNINIKIESVTRGEDLHHVIKEVERRNGQF